MLVVEDLKIVDTGPKQFTGFFEADSMFSFIGGILRVIPCDPHFDSLSC